MKAGGAFSQHYAHIMLDAFVFVRTNQQGKALAQKVTVGPGYGTDPIQVRIGLLRQGRKARSLRPTMLPLFRLANGSSTMQKSTASSPGKGAIFLRKRASTTTGLKSSNPKLCKMVKCKPGLLTIPGEAWSKSRFEQLVCSVGVNTVND